MTDRLVVPIGRSIRAASGTWYRNHQVLGAGGNAVALLVVATSGPHKGVPFALKIFRRMSKPERRTAFLKEVEFLESCDHPSVMRVFDRGTFKYTVDGRDLHFPFMVAEYLPRTLYGYLRSAQMPMVERVSFALQLLSGLAYLETLTPQVVHRDIKPQNIFVKGRSCVLGDFGLMKVVDEDDGEDREVFKESIGPGMPFFYRTPDLVAYANNEAPITAKSDVFQLGLVLAELFSGRNPAKRPQRGGMLRPVELEPLGTIPGALSGSTASLLERMLEMDADHRPSASELMDGWMGLFENVADRTSTLNGRIF